MAFDLKGFGVLVDDDTALEAVALCLAASGFVPLGFAAPGVASFGFVALVLLAPGIASFGLVEHGLAAFGLVAIVL